MESALDRKTFLNPTIEVARQLLGQCVVRRFEDGAICIGRIVETEAYTVGDPACHAFRGISKANAAMFGSPGHAYIHINYGLHYCLNAVTQAEGIPEAVLIRAIEPLENAALMYRNYTGDIVSEDIARQEKRIGAGPGRLTKALQIDKHFDGVDLTDSESPLFLISGATVSDNEVTTTTRIGITKAADYPWRFYVTASPFVSRRAIRVK